MDSWRQPNVQDPSNPPLNGNRNPAFGVPPRWDARALLNPRSLPSQQQSQPLPQRPFQNGFANHAPPQQQSFQFDSPGGQPQQNYHTHPSPQRSPQPAANSHGGFAGYANGGGMGQMLERMHQVTERDMMPQKRQKIRDDRPESARKAEFHGGGRGGVIGEYMREKREEGRKEQAARPTNGAVVDISADDDDVVVVEDAGDKEVCYGRIEGAEINAHRVPTPRPGAHAINPQFWPQVKILLKRRYGEKTFSILAVDSTREIIGCVDINTSIGLAPLLDQPAFSIRTAARILTRPKKTGDPEPGTGEVSIRYGLDLNVYGPKRYAMQVGRHLSQKQVYLRTPLFTEAGTELYNPHSIEKPPQQPLRAPGGYGSRIQGPARTTEEIRNDVMGMFDSLEHSDSLPEMEPAPQITTELLKHQKQGLYFMTNKEKERVFGSEEKGNSSLWRLRIGGNGQRSYYNVITGQEDHRSPPQVLGGILADMMGLGKTLSILSLIVTTLDQSTEWTKLPPCVVKACDQTQSKRGKKAHLPVCEPVQPRLNAKTTLLISPLSTIANWEEQIKQHVEPGTLKYYVYHGSTRIKDIEKLAEFDLVITTYGSVASEFNHRSKKKEGKYPLEEINWFRIVLDEAHMIREQSTQQSKAICRLSAQRRWAVTGTPVQNRLEDLGALMAFLRIKPFDERGGFAQYIMAPFKMCDPEILPKLRLLVDSITLRRLKNKIDLPARHDKLIKLQFNDEERTLYEVFAKNASDRVKVIVGQREKSLGGKSYVHILQSILRLRLICAHGKDLLGEEDLKVMSGLSKDSAIDLDSDEDDDQPSLSPKQAYDMYNLMKETNADLCLLCTRKIGPNEAVENDAEPKDEIIGHMTPCFHILCPGCIDRFKSNMEELAQGHSQASCPICNAYIKLSYFALRQGGVEDEEDSRMQTKNGKRSKVITNYSGPHTKTKALVHDLLMSKQESEFLPPDAPIKSVVLSGWTAHLDLIQMALEENGITYTRLDGKMSLIVRRAVLDNFREDPSIHVILVSITAGGLGLNLTAANKVYVMEPQYNPQSEAQAVDRVHRLGQKREVDTVRYIMQDSFEEKMLELQDKKKKLAQLSMDSEGGRKSMDKAEAARKRLEDLRSLFK